MRILAKMTKIDCYFTKTAISATYQSDRTGIEQSNYQHNNIVCSNDIVYNLYNSITQDTSTPRTMF